MEIGMFAPMTVYRHKKTGGLYTEMARGKLEADLTPMVIYRAHKDGTVWVRPVSEFDDGRFEKVIEGLLAGK